MAESFTAKGFLVTLRGRAAHPSEAASQNGLEVSEVLGTFLQQINQANDLKPNQSQGREPYIPCTSTSKEKVRKTHRKERWEDATKSRLSPSTRTSKMKRAPQICRLYIEEHI